MIILPKDSVAIERDLPKKKTSTLIYDNPEDKPEDTGTIIYTGETHKSKVNYRVKFRESFVEPVEIEGKTYLFARDLDSSIFYLDSGE